MELSTAEGALRTLRLRPKAPEGAVTTSAALLPLVEAVKAGAPPPTAALDLERGVLTLLAFAQERWEPVAVACVVVRDLLHHHFDRIQAEAEAHASTTATATEEPPLPVSPTFLKGAVRAAVHTYLEHYEPRVRMSVALLAGALARWDLHWTADELLPDVIDSVQCNLTRSPDFEETGWEEGMEEDDDNVSVNGMESPAGTPRTPSTPHRLDDVSGWKALESSLCALKCIMEGGGASFLATAAESSSPAGTEPAKPKQEDDNDDGENYVYFTSEVRELATTKSVFHINRHVRVVGLDTITVLCELAPVGFLDTHEALTKLLCKCIVRGLQDNWSQVRYAASIANRAFLMKLQPPARETVFPVLVPRICLNRYYVAERVQKHSQETWRLLMGDRGRAVVAQYVNEIVDYYIEMTDHCVREAACHCIAELATKVDKSAVRAHVPRLLEALLYSFRDNSWLVRDAACLASSQFVLAFPEESRDALEQFYELWIDHLSDEIWSVREDAAVALGNVIRAYGKEALDRVTVVAEDFLGRAKTQPAMSQHEHEALLHSEKAHMSKQAFSCCSFEPKTDERHEHHEKQPWQQTDGAIYLVRELCAVAPEVGISLLPAVADVAILRHFPQTATLQETVWKQVPQMCRALGKRAFKQHLELFLDPMTFTLQGSHRLARFAARDCVAQLSQEIGPNIFRGRLQANPVWLEAIGPVVPMQPVM